MKGNTDTVIDQKRFVEKLSMRFPELKPELNDECIKGNITTEVDVFLRYTQNAIDSGNEAVAEKCFSFLQEIMPSLDHETENSIVISYLGRLNFRSHPQYLRLLSPEMKEVVSRLEQYYKKLREES